MKRYLIILSLFFTSLLTSAQDKPADRLERIADNLNALSVTLPGLKEKVQLSVAGASAQEYLRALAIASNLNIYVDPQLNFKVYNSFNNETPLNVLLFVAKEFGVDIRLTGSIISILPLPPAAVPIPVKQVQVSYNAVNGKLSYELSRDSLSAVARKITQVSGQNLIVPASLLSRTVSGFIKDAGMEAALEKLAFANDLKLFRTGDGIFVFQPLEDGERLYMDAANNAAVKRPLRALQGTAQGNFNISGVKDTSGRKLLNVEAINTPIADLIKAAAQEMQADYYLYQDVPGNATLRLAKIAFDDFLTVLLQGSKFTYKIDNGVYAIGDRSLEGLRATKMVKLHHRSLDTIQHMLPEQLKAGVTIREFREQNTLLLAGSAPQIIELEQYIQALDQVVPMVLIEVTLVDVRKGKSISTGIRAGVADSVKTGGTVFPGLDYTFGASSVNDFLARLGRNNSVNLGRVPANFYVRLSALENNSNVDIRSVPKLSTLNGHKASLSIGSSRFYSTKTQNVIPSLNAQTVVTEQFTEVNANLEIGISPVVSGDEQVTLNITVNISDFIGDPPLNAPPPKSTSKFSSIIRARNEDMIVLGGLERTERTEKGSGVPLLSRIPILKWLFSSREKADSKVVTLVFIKPVIMY